MVPEMKRLFEERIKENLWRYYFVQLGLTDWERRSEKRIKEDLTFFPERIKKLERYIGKIRDKRTLSVGSGWGGFVVAASKAGADAVGVEPDAEEIVISKLRANVRNAKSEFICSVGEYLPFKDNSFDFIECVTVLEHVKEPEKVVEEMIRVVRKGGFIYILIPNYLYPFEQHYKIYWIPMLPKPLAKIFLRLKGRPPDFIDGLIYITPSRLIKALKRHDIEINDITPATTYQIMGKKPLKGKLMSICGKIFDMLGIKSSAEMLIQKR
jgi:2-polyprenyl-3-methyl-5-hydroxy-6-metoxy-1,4-benzoquinol methylase